MTKREALGLTLIICPIVFLVAKGMYEVFLRDPIVLLYTALILCPVIFGFYLVASNPNKGRKK